jgi:Flp pilus assembly secretin CpaC
MKKPRLCLALSATIALLQANLLQVGAAPAKIAGNSNQEKVTSVVKKTASTIRISSHTNKATKVLVPTTNGIAASNMSGQVMLFLGNSKQANAKNGKTPAAALTIHTSIPEESTQVVGNNPVSEPTLVAMKESPVVSDGSPAVEIPSNITDSPKQLLAQLAPDQIIAQADTNTTPIPPVVSGAVDLEEFKPSNSIDLKVSQSRTFKLKNKIIRTSISDPAVAEPVVVAENQMVLLGKAPGSATLVIWDDAGNSVAIDVKVNRDFSQLQAMVREIDPRIIIKPFSVGGSDRVILSGDVDHVESVIKAFATANSFMDDRGMNITVANGRILGVRIGELGGTQMAGQQSGQLSAIGQVDRYTFFGNQNNNISKAQTMISDGGRVTSLIKVRKTPLVVLHCTFMEMNSAAVRELGVQLGINYTSNSFAFGIGGNNNVSQANAPALFSFGGQNGPVAVAPTGTIAGSSQSPAFGAATTVTYGGVNFPISQVGLGSLNGPPALLGGTTLFGIPGGATFTGLGLANLYTAVSNFASGNRARWGVNPTVNGIITHSRARILAEPTLVTISGERASFLAGGEIPILQSIATAGTAAQSVVYEPYGLRLNMIPVLLENGGLSIQVAPEERLLDRANGLNLFGIGTSSIPAFVTRKTQTTVEMKPGQELFISGLVTANHGRELTKTPLIGEVPVLGALYRSKAFSKNESELVVAIRPEVILPGTPGQLRVPDEISKVEGPRDTNMFQVEPTILDEGHMRKGRAEKSLQLPNTLPPGAPVPPNN